MAFKDLLKVLEDNKVEVTDDLKKELKKNYPEDIDTDNLFTQEDVNSIIQKRLSREQKLHEQEIKDLKDSMKNLVDPEKVQEYEAKVKELETERDKIKVEIKTEYELLLAAKDAGVKDTEFFEFLVEKKGLKERLKLDDDGNVVATDEEGNVLSEDGKKLGPEKLVQEIIEEKPEICDKNRDKDIGGGGGNPPSKGSKKEVKSNTRNLAIELGYKQKDDKE